MLLLSILTFITVVLIMTGTLVPVLMYAGVILVVLYVLVLIKNLFVSLFSPAQGSTGLVQREEWEDATVESTQHGEPEDSQPDEAEPGSDDERPG